MSPRWRPFFFFSFSFSIICLHFLIVSITNLYFSDCFDCIVAPFSPPRCINIYSAVWENLLRRLEKTAPRYAKNHSAVLILLDFEMELRSLRFVALFPSVLFLPSYADVFCTFSLFTYFLTSCFVCSLLNNGKICYLCTDRGYCPFCTL